MDLAEGEQARRCPGEEASRQHGQPRQRQAQRREQQQEHRQQAHGRTDRHALDVGRDRVLGGDGVPVRTRLELAMLRDDANSYATVEVNFARNARLDMWVPVRMREVYMEVRDTRIKETLIAEASYSNFRRFETAVRIMPAPAGRPPSR